MAEKLTIARPYAKAVFEQALAGSGLDDWEKILQGLAIIAHDNNASALLDNPLISNEQRLDLFLKVMEKTLTGLTETRHAELKNFLKALILEKRLNILPEIFQRYESLLASEKELKEVIVISAHPLNEERRKQMTEALSRYLHSKVVVDFKEDVSLIGGAIIRTGNWVMDGSIKSKLQSLRDNLQE